MGDKARAKRLARKVGVPVVPGTDGEDVDGDALEVFARAQGLPIVIKALAGGGGKGMRVVRDGAELPRALAAARREAEAAFGDGACSPTATSSGRATSRCRCWPIDTGAACTSASASSLQRRHQKVIEEAPSPAVDAALRERMGACAIALAVACGYEGAGTVEFIVPAASEEFFFLR